VMQHMGAEDARGTMPWHSGCCGAYCERYIGTGGNIAGEGIPGGHAGPAYTGSAGTYKGSATGSSIGRPGCAGGSSGGISADGTGGTAGTS
ncbi:MAG: mechanosensitive ion channel family protein, partial [Planctomyces sp.]